MLITRSKQQSSFLASFKAWRRAGEEGALAAYRKSVRILCLVQLCGIALFVFAFPQLSWTTLGIGALAMCCNFGLGRRAIIFTETEVVYRPPLGPPRRIPVASIQRIKRSRVLVPYMLRDVTLAGVNLSLEDGTTLDWPLDFEAPEEILKRLSVLAGKTVD
jgi:hypothetical protein